MANKTMLNSPIIDDLVKQIRHHNDLYYNQDSPEISDFEYDNLVKELKKLDPNNSVFSELGESTFGEKLKHEFPMGSLLKCHTPEEIYDEYTGKTLVAMPKIDGCSLSLTYEYYGGIYNLSKAVTRGNGLIGENVLDNVKFIKNIPKKINSPVPLNSKIEIRGEIYVDNKWFYENEKEIQKLAGRTEPFKNPRNYASGSLKQKEAKITGQRNLSFVSYILFDESTINRNKEDELILLKDLGFEVVEYKMLSTKDIILVDEAIQYFTEFRQKSHYDLDGIVFWVNNKKEFNSYGIKDYTPKGALAYKFETDKKETEVLDIEWSTTRTGKIVPVMQVKEVQIAGTSVRRVTLNNIDYIKSNDVAIGDTVLIEKANEIIPKLVSVVSRPKNRRLNIPNHCPSCSSPIIKHQGAHLICLNSSCPSQIAATLLHFFRCLEIEGFSVKSIEMLVDSGILDSKDLFEISVEDFAKVGFGPTQSASLWDQLHNIKISKSKFLKSLGITGAGERTFSKVLETIDFDDLIDKNFDLTQLKLIVGPKTGDAIYEGLSDKQTFIKQVLPYIEIEEPAAPVAGNLTGKTFCITGTLSKKRTEVEKIITDNGGKIAGVNKNLDYLIVGIDPGSKLTKANQLNVQAISEKDFEKITGIKIS